MRSLVVTVDLVDDPIQVCLPPSHPEGGHSRVDLERLRDERFVAGRRGSACHAFARALCAHAGFEPKIAFETDEGASTCALVIVGIGVALMPQLLAGTAARPLVTRELTPAVPPRRISAVYRSSARRLASIEAAVGALAEAAADGAGGAEASMR